MITSAYSQEALSFFFKDNYDNNHNINPLKAEPPPFVGCIIADKFGKTLFSYELFSGSIDFFLKRDIRNKGEKEDLSLELIPMFISALEAFSQEINIQDLPGLKLEGRNIKLQTIFSYEDYTIILFLNPNVNMKLMENRIKTYFSYLFEVYNNDFKNIHKMSSSNFILHLKLLGKIWLEDLNKIYERLILIN